MNREQRLVFGLGRSGLGVLRYLKKRGLEACFFDEMPKAEEVAEAKSLGFVFDPEPSGTPYREVVAAPGVPITHPLLEQLRKLGAEVIGEAELAFRTSPTPLIGITGTAGKTSCTLYTAHFLRALGFNAAAGGNVDPPLVSVIDDAEVVAVELSSFQLERVASFRPRVAVLLNLGTDHLDRHGGLEAYHRAKLNILKNLTSNDVVVYNAGDPNIVPAAEASPARKAGFLPGVSPRETNLAAARLAASAFAELMGRSVDQKVLDLAEKTAPRPEGRFDLFAKRGDVLFIDDSIATRINAVRAALEAAPAPVAWLLGGRDKGAPVHELSDLARAKVRLILAIGEDGPSMSRVFEGICPVTEIHQPTGRETLEQAVTEALAKLTSGSVLLAPLGTSFDQFKDYKERSRVFREVVFAHGAIPVEAGAGEPWISS